MKSGASMIKEGDRIERKISLSVHNGELRRGTVRTIKPPDPVFGRMAVVQWDDGKLGIIDVTDLIKVGNHQESNQIKSIW
jgi:hypothetical protein